MRTIKKVASHIFIDGFGGMTQGLFATLIIGTMIQQIGLLIGGSTGNVIYLLGKAAAALTSAGIGVGVAVKYGESPLVTVSAAVAAMVGGYAGKITGGTFFVDGNAVLAGPGEPLGAFIAAFAGITCGHLVSGKTKVDIIVTPVITIGAGSVVGLLVGPPISQMMTGLGSIINWATEQRPFIMGIVVSVVMGMVLTLPISSAALGIILNLSGLAAGAATIGCCCNMVGFAVASYRENKFGGLVAQGLGTSMLQVPNIMRHPLIWLPVIFSSAILGPVSTILANMQNNATGSGMGSAGLVGQITTYQTMIAYDDPKLVIIKIILLHFVLPAAITLFFSEVFSQGKPDQIRRYGFESVESVFLKGMELRIRQLHSLFIHISLLIFSVFTPFLLRFPHFPLPRPIQLPLPLLLSPFLPPAAHGVPLPLAQWSVPSADGSCQGSARGTATAEAVRSPHPSRGIQGPR